MQVWWLCWHRTILMKNIRQKQYSQFPSMQVFGKCDEAWPMYHVWPISQRFMLGRSGGMWPTCCHWHGRWALSNHVWAHSVVSMGHVICLQHLARACSEQSRSTSVLPINHVIQMPQCLSRFFNHNYSPSMGFLPDTQNYRLRMCLECRERFPRHGSLALTTCITACMWHSVMHDRSAK